MSADAASLDGGARTLDVLSFCSGTNGGELGAAAGSSNGLQAVFADNVFALEINCDDASGVSIGCGLVASLLS